MTTVPSNSIKNHNEEFTNNDQVEIIARNLLDVKFKYTWKIGNYLRHVDTGKDIDSPCFEFNINGIRTKWSISLRFWSDENGGRLSNPVVICLNLISYFCEEKEQIEIRHQFGIWNAIVKQYEICPFAKQRVVLNENKTLPNNNGILSIGYRDIIILDRHLTGGTVELFCKIILLRSKVEQHTLALDLWDKFKAAELCDITLRSAEGEKFQAHKTILASRSPVLASMISRGDSILNFQMPSAILKSFLEYIYTDHVDPLDSPQGLLKIACKYELPGLKNICEGALIDSINPLNVAAMLLLADTFDCDQLKKAGLAYCEENSGSIIKTLAWKVMEHLNPQLFDEVCQLN